MSRIAIGSGESVGIIECGIVGHGRSCVLKGKRLREGRYIKPGLCSRYSPKPVTSAEATDDFTISATTRSTIYSNLVQSPSPRSCAYFQTRALRSSFGLCLSASWAVTAGLHS